MAVPELVLAAMPRHGRPDSHWAAGAWCFAHQEELFPDWEKRFVIAPEPLTDMALATTAARAAQALAEKQLPAVARLLCADAAAFPASYWRVLLAPFMIEVASQIVERALRAQALVAAWGNAPLSVPLLPANCSFAFADEQDFTLRGSLGTQFNHWLFSFLLQGQWPKKWQKQMLPAYCDPGLPPPGMKQKLKSWLRGILASVPFPKFRGMSMVQSLRFSWALRKPIKGPLRECKRQDFARDLTQIPLPLDTLPIFAQALPRSLKKLRHKPIKPKTSTPKLRIVPTAAGELTQVRQKLARWRGAGNALAHCQHGAIYGQVANPCAAAFTEYREQAFFTWGWAKYGRTIGNFVPLPSPLLSTLPSYARADNNLIFVGTEMSAYGRRLDSHPSPMQYVTYRKAKRTFVTALPENIRREILYRPYFPLPGTLSDAPWLLHHCPELRLCSGPLLPQILRCRLLVLDHPGTTMLEALAAKVPFVAYWDANAWPWSSEASELLAKLEACGIWHSTPVSAAGQVAKIWHNVDEWWAGTQAAREEFVRAQACTADNFARIWIETLEKI